MARFILVFTVLGLSACGDQAINPLGNPQIAALRDTSRFGSLANAALLQTIDGLNFGDSAYTKAGERILSESSCSETQRLVQKTQATQWVNDDSPVWTARSNVTIDRNYETSLFQGRTLLTCAPGLVDFKSIDQATFKLQSKVVEKKKRQMFLVRKSDGQERSDVLDVKTLGTRDLEFTGFNDSTSQTALSATLRSSLDLTLALKDEFDEAADATMSLAPSSRLDFEVRIDKASGTWSNYLIPFSRQVYELGEGSSMTLEFSQLTFTPNGNCLPQSGSIRVTRTVDSQVTGVFAGEINPKADLVLLDKNSGETLTLSPFACVLREH